MMGRFIRDGSVRKVALLGAAMVCVLTAWTDGYAQSVNPVTITSEAQIERSTTGSDGKEQVVLKKPSDVVVVPGDRVVFTLKYSNQGGQVATGFAAVNPMPGPVQFLSAAEDWADVSVDGGKSWGRLSALKVTVPGNDGAPATVRPAAAEDVTHVRWVFSDPIPPGTVGYLSYRGLIK